MRVLAICWVLSASNPGASSAAPPADSGATAEEPEESQEGAGAGAGVSPVELIPRLELRQSFQRLGNGVSVHATTTEADIRLLDRVLLRYELPLRLVRTADAQIAGAGDLRLQAITLLFSNPQAVAVAITGAVLDTASQPPLGAGKQQVVLGGGVAIKPRRWWLAYAVVQEQLSVAGDRARPDVNQLLARVGNIVFGKGHSWYKVDLDTAVDFEDDRVRLFGAIEVGSLLIGRVGLFLRAGTQLLGQRQLDYSLDAGLRYLFRLEAPNRSAQ